MKRKKIRVGDFVFMDYSKSVFRVISIDEKSRLAFERPSGEKVYILRNEETGLEMRSSIQYLRRVDIKKKISDEMSSC